MTLIIAHNNISYLNITVFEIFFYHLQMREMQA